MERNCKVIAWMIKKMQKVRYQYTWLTIYEPERVKYLPGAALPNGHNTRECLSARTLPINKRRQNWGSGNMMEALTNLRRVGWKMYYIRNLHAALSGEPTLKPRAAMRSWFSPQHYVQGNLASNEKVIWADEGGKSIKYTPPAGARLASPS